MGDVALEIPLSALDLVRLRQCHDTRRTRVEVLAQCEDAAALAGRVPAFEDEHQAKPFIDDMATAYRDAQLVICRAGATTIAELTACGRPALMIPFPFAAGDHQTANARAMVEVGAARMFVQKDLTPEILAIAIAELWQNQSGLQQMAEAAASLGQRDAARRVVEVCTQVLTEG